MAEELLIEAIRELPCLWKHDTPYYKDSGAKVNAWKQVAAKVSRFVMLFASNESQLNSFKLLGVIVNNHLTWDDHIELICDSVTSTIIT